MPKSSIILPTMTLWQPWASLVAVGAKPYETRPRAPYKNLMGKRVAIHASMRRPRHNDVDDETFDAICDVFGRQDWMTALPLGAVICTAIISEAIPGPEAPKDLFGDYGEGRWAWKLDDVVTFDPVPAKGQQLWGWPWIAPKGLKVGDFPVVVNHSVPKGVVEFRDRRGDTVGKITDVRVA